MTKVAAELDETLQQLDGPSASLLERLVRDALALVRQHSAASRTTGFNGWPLGYFDSTAGAFENESLEAPDDPPPASNPQW